MRLLRSILFLAALALMPLVAQAADPDANIGKLKAIFQSFVEYQKSLSQLNPNAPKLESDGDIMVEKAEGYYAVTLPHERLIYADGSKLDIGMLSVNASPGDQAGQWKMALAIPTPIVMFNAQQQPSFKITIGGQKAAGVWDESLENFAKLDAAYANMTVAAVNGAYTIHLPDSKIRYDFTKQSDGRWSGPAAIVLNNIDGAIATNNAKFKIGQTNIDFNVNRYNPQTVKTYQTKIAALAQPGVTPNRLTPDQSANLSKMVLDLILNASDGMKVNYAVSGVEVNMLNPNNQTPENFKLGKGFFGMDANGILSEKCSFIFSVGFDGLNIEPPPTGSEGIMPSTMNINWAFHDIPTRQLAEMANNTIEGITQQPDMAAMAGLSLMMKAPAILSQAGTKLDVAQNYIGNNDYRFDVSGGAHADINAVNSFTGEFKGVFKGLDKLITRMQAVVAGGYPAAPNAQNLLNALRVLKANGKPQLGANGQNDYSFDFVMTPQGQTLANGKPLNLAPAAH